MPIEGPQNISPVNEFVYVPSDFIMAKRELSGTKRLYAFLANHPEILNSAINNPPLLNAIRANPSLLTALKTNPGLLEALRDNPKLLGLIQAQPGFLDALKANPELLTALEKKAAVPVKAKETEGIKRQSSKEKIKSVPTETVPRKTFAAVNKTFEKASVRTIMNTLAMPPLKEMKVNSLLPGNIQPRRGLPQELIAESRILGPALLSLLGSIAITTGKLRVTGPSREVGVEQETESERQASALEEPEQVSGVGEISEARTVTDTQIR